MLGCFVTLVPIQIFTFEFSNCGHYRNSIPPFELFNNMTNTQCLNMSLGNLTEIGITQIGKELSDSPEALLEPFKALPFFDITGIESMEMWVSTQFLDEGGHYILFDSPNMTLVHIAPSSLVVEFDNQRLQKDNVEFSQQTHLTLSYNSTTCQLCINSTCEYLTQEATLPLDEATSDSALVQVIIYHVAIFKQFLNALEVNSLYLYKSLVKLSLNITLN